MAEAVIDAADHADRVLAECRARGHAAQADVQNLNRCIHLLVAECRSLTATVNGLSQEFGILDDGKTAPYVAIPEASMNAALEVRAKGVFAPGSNRPARLMTRRATGWQEIPGPGARGAEKSAATKSKA